MLSAMCGFKVLELEGAHLGHLVAQ